MPPPRRQPPVKQPVVYRGAPWALAKPIHEINQGRQPRLLQRRQRGQASSNTFAPRFARRTRTNASKRLLRSTAPRNGNSFLVRRRPRLRNAVVVLHSRPRLRTKERKKKRRVPTTPKDMCHTLYHHKRSRSFPCKGCNAQKGRHLCGPGTLLCRLERASSVSWCTTRELRPLSQAPSTALRSLTKRGLGV